MDIKQNRNVGNGWVAGWLGGGMVGWSDGLAKTEQWQDKLRLDGLAEAS